VAVIGLVARAPYILDFLVKTPVAGNSRLRFDFLHVHNAFRSPGRLEDGELGKPKAQVYAGRYDSFRHGLRIERKLIDATSDTELDGVTFAFVCVDKGEARSKIFDLSDHKENTVHRRWHWLEP